MGAGLGVRLVCAVLSCKSFLTVEENFFMGLDEHGLFSLGLGGCLDLYHCNSRHAFLNILVYITLILYGFIVYQNRGLKPI